MRAGIALLFLMAMARGASATPYETFVDVEDQADLDDLLASGDITTDTYEELLELLTNGVDLNTGDRAQLYALPNLTYEDVDAIIAYREAQNGVIGDPAGLVLAGAITEDKLLAISAFIVVRQAEGRLKLRGFAQAMTRFAPSDSDADEDLPPFATRGRFGLLKNLRFGYAAVVTRLQIGDPTYDPNRDALIAERPGTQFHLPKIYVQYETDDVAAIAGSFRAGFGQRLVFDNSSRYTPNGLTFDDQLFFSSELASICRESGAELPSPCVGAARYQYVTPDWRWSQGLFGVGAGLKKVPIGSGWLQLYAWGSSSRKSIYQYELYDKRKCTDPYMDSPECAAPPVFVKPDGDLLEPTTRHSFQTLPNVFRENLAGANIGYFADRRNSVGITGYYAKNQNLLNGVDLDFQEWSRYPTGLAYAAGGANFSFGSGPIDVFGEVAYSYDKSPDPIGPIEGGGGPAAIMRITHTHKRQEIEGVLRYYSIDHENPYARPIAQSDELDGSRARDEAGGRVRYTRTDKLYSVRAAVDVWTPLTTMQDEMILGEKRAQLKLDTYLRADARTSHETWAGLWVRFQDKDLKEGGQDECFEVSTEENETGETIPCKGRQFTTLARVRYQPNKLIHLTGMLEHQFLDDESVTMGKKFRQDWGAWLIALWHPQPGVRVRGRVRYLDESSDLLGGGADDNLETSVSVVLDAAFRVRDKDSVRVRADGKFYVDDRTSTDDREPNPDLVFWLQYEAKL